MSKPPTHPPCYLCARPTRVRSDGTLTMHRVRQDPAAAWCDGSGTDPRPVALLVWRDTA